MNLRPHRTEPPRIDLTPLIDVVFLMLIFFMVSTTFDKQSQLEVDLPEASATEIPDAVEDDRIQITIDAAGNFYVDDRELVTHDAQTLRRAMEKAADGRRDLPVLVSGDRNAPLQSMMTVLDVAGQLGMAHLSFLTRQAEGAD
jgi:biopolymer transport protein ExbD